MSDKLKEKMRIIFNKYDENKNGVLEKVEFMKVFKSLGEDISSNEIDKIAEDAISNFDLNQNGTIEFTEFCQLISFLINEKGLNL